MATEAKTNYLAKLLTLLVKRSDGSIKIPIQDLMVDDIGQGISVHFNQETKELVLSFVPAGTTIYKIENGVTWLSPNQSFPQTLKPDSKPLSQDELIAKVWTESAATPTTLESQPQVRKNKVVTLTSEGQAEAELERRKQKALREIESYSSPQPPLRQREVFIKP